jgi:hypothetical protein
MPTSRINGSVIKNAAVDFRFIAVRKLARFRAVRAGATLFGWNVTSTMMHLPRRLHLADRISRRVDKEPASRRLQIA